MMGNRNDPAVGTILVLGAGRGQVGLIRAGKRMGLRTLVASLPSPTAPGISLADEVVWVDIADPARVEEAVGNLRLDAVVTSGADSGLPALGRLCDALSLPGLSEKAAKMSADKKLMKDAFIKTGVRTARYRLVKDVQQLRAATELIGLPVIIKAPDLQGSQGIVIVRDERGLESALDDVLVATTHKEVIVEEFIDGIEFGAQALVRQGEVHFVLLHNDGVHMAQTAVPILHSVPLQADAQFQQRAIDETKKAIAAVGLDNCAVNVDLISRNGEIYVIELTGRVGANGLAELVSEHFGIDYYEEILRLALGHQPQDRWTDGSAARPAVVVKMIIAPHLSGTLSGIDVDTEQARGAEILFFRRAGDRVNGFSHSGDCIGQITVKADSVEAAEAIVEAAERGLSLTTDAPR